MLRDLISKIEFEVDSKTSMQELGRSRLEKQVARLEKSAAGRTDDAELRVRMKARAVDTLESEMVVLRNQFEECHNLAKAMKRESHRFVDYHSMERRLETAAPLNARVSTLSARIEADLPGMIRDVEADAMRRETETVMLQQCWPVAQADLNRDHQKMMADIGAQFAPTDENLRLLYAEMAAIREAIATAGGTADVPAR